jgi:hypothetical protein
MFDLRRTTPEAPTSNVQWYWYTEDKTNAAVGYNRRPPGHVSPHSTQDIAFVKTGNSSGDHTNAVTREVDAFMLVPWSAPRPQKPLEREEFTVWAELLAPWYNMHDSEREQSICDLSVLSSYYSAFRLRNCDHVDSARESKSKNRQRPRRQDPVSVMR